MLEVYKHWVWLSSLSKVSTRKQNQLIEYFGDIKNVWYASESDLTKIPFLTQTNISQLIDKELRDNADRLLDKIYKSDIKILTINDELYPEYLKNIYDPPIVLYVKGNIEKEEKNIAIVGSRKATMYGLKMAESISKELAAFGVTVVSGMARGIDSYAHNGALKAGGRTIAVLGCGLDTAYPYENIDLMKMITDSGAVVSEYVPGVPPLSHNFPARNRIISGFSLGVVVIEAGERSGSLITANFALEQGREVFAVPGNVSSINSKGTNKLIKEGAKLVTQIEDIIEELKVLQNTNNNTYSKNKKVIKRDPLYGLSEEERTVVECLMIEPLHIDKLVEKSGFSIQTINSLLIMMELKGVIQQSVGKVYHLRELML